MAVLILPLVITNKRVLHGEGGVWHAPSSRPVRNFGDIPRIEVDGLAICHPAAMIFQSLFLLPVLVTLLRVLEVRGYIPGLPSNVTVQGSGQVNTPRLHLQWQTNGYVFNSCACRPIPDVIRFTRFDWEYVTQQSVGPNASDDPVQVRVQRRFILASLTSLKGIFVHFTEDNAGNETSACMCSLMLWLLSVDRCSNYAMDWFCIL